MAGKLIVVEGGDGAGKATQAKLLIDHLESDGYSVRTLDFPRYTENHYGRLIRECLDGKRGDFMKMDARVDRYVSANMMHQGAKLEDESELPDLIEWIDHTEFEILKVPRPDVTFYFDIPHQIRQKLKQQAVSEGKHTGELDAAERDQEHQRLVGERAQKIVDLRPDWRQITCCKADGALRSRKDIHEEVYRIVSELL